MSTIAEQLTELELTLQGRRAQAEIVARKGNRTPEELVRQQSRIAVLADAFRTFQALAKHEDAFRKAVGGDGRAHG